MFTRIQELFPRELNRHGLAKAVTASSICDHLKVILSQIFPEEAREFMAPRSFKDGALTIQVPDGAWAEIILSRKGDIIKAMNAKFGERTIQQLKAKIDVPESDSRMSPEQEY